MTREESIQGTVDADIGGAGGDTDIGDARESEGDAGGGSGEGAVGNIDADIGGTGGSEGIELEDISIFGVPRGSGEGAVGNTNAGGSSSKSSSRSARLTTGGSEGGARGDTDIGGTGESEGIEVEDVGSFGVPRGSEGGAVGNIDADISGTGGSEGIELEDIGSFRVPRGSGEGAVCNTDAGGSSSRSSSCSARLTTGHGGIAQGGRSSIIACCCGGFTFILKNYFQFFDMTREESIQGTVDADVGGAGGDTDIGGTGGSEGIDLEDVGSFGVPRGSGGVLWRILMLILLVQEEVKALSLKILVVLKLLGAAERVLWGILMLVEALARALAGVQD
ncbi:hypothetical protein GH714_018915 [Hevea brasiliensis]|uniref:Uncharacterized protein n=1 Tax=Hevea brasiliensis TaxID=3981 RepID=A0A6A6KTH1_HEVBR|nr:hypothetical protein GH714_018915 [Hevea brasiliensis]